MGAGAIGYDTAASGGSTLRGGGLSPLTLPRYLLAAAGTGARDVRINGVYGSGQDGVWEFVAHLSWQTSTGQLSSAAFVLPMQLTAPASETTDTALAGRQLADEQRIGWTPQQLQHVLDQTTAIDNAPLALLELQTADAGSELTTCRAGALPTAGGTSPAACTDHDLADHATTFSDQIQDSSDDGPLSVQRLGHLLGS